MFQLGLSRQKWVTKNASENCGVCMTLMAWEKIADPSCPLCGSPENTTHMLQCKQKGAEDVWKANYAKTRDHLIDANTHPDLQNVVLLRLHQWRYNQPFSFPAHWATEVTRSIQD